MTMQITAIPSTRPASLSAKFAGIQAQNEQQPLTIPDGHVGPIVLSNTGRVVYWTGRVAIGLRHQPVRYEEPLSHGANWIQQLMLKSRKRANASTNVGTKTVFS
jgi:hypothetical protein